MTISASQIKELRDATGVGFLDCRKALEEANGDFEKAVDFLRERGLAKAAKRSDREASEGVLELYNHGNGRVGVIVEVNCETDFVARSETFRNFAHEIALQIAASAPQWVLEADIPEDVLDREKEIARNRALEEGKPEHILDRIVDGRIKKFKEEAVLMQQPYIRDEDLTIEKFLHETIAAIGENIIIRRFVRWEVGEASAS
jgi:elongation factor Ts